METRHVQELFEGHWRNMVRLAVLLQADDPEDLVAEALARLYLRRADVRTSSSGLAYLRQTVFNLQRDQARHQEVVRRKMPVPAGTAAEAPPNAAIAAAIRRLPRRQREALVLRYWPDLSQREIAKTMSITIGSVKTHLARAIAEIREVMAQEERS